MTENIKFYSSIKSSRYICNNRESAFSTTLGYKGPFDLIILAVSSAVEPLTQINTVLQPSSSY